MNETIEQINSAEANLDKESASEERGVPLSDFVNDKKNEVDEGTFKFLEFMLKQNPLIGKIEVKFVLPEDEPCTGGFFTPVVADGKESVPVISIVKRDLKHINNVIDIRKSSAKAVAQLLEIDFSEMTPDLLRLFIIAHELGHATDYIANYESNPDYLGDGAEAVEEWKLHYDVNLLMMPVPGFDPVELRDEFTKYDNLDLFYEAHPEVKKYMNTDSIESFADLMDAQENAYRNSEYERFADGFATKFLKGNAKELNLSQLVKKSKAA
ncbi:hypothetical protein HOB30_02400 [Candidatus Falkowbacteria bacterium]|jgi:hypothetical protein|nr:hypothetical protein [Candidatus Falkowbacteria bacterium]